MKTNVDIVHFKGKIGIKFKKYRFFAVKFTRIYANLLPKNNLFMLTIYLLS